LNELYDNNPIVLNAFYLATLTTSGACVELRVISTLMGMHIEVTKTAVFYVYGTTTVGATADQYEKQHSSTRNLYVPGVNIVQHTPLANHSKP